MSDDWSKFELPSNIERYLAALSKLYGQEGKKIKQEIIVNSKPRVIENWSYDKWDDGRYGHALYLTIPEQLYLKNVRSKDDIENRIRDDINRIHTRPNEFIEVVFLEIGDGGGDDWRGESGLLHSWRRTVSERKQGVASGGTKDSEYS